MFHESSWSVNYYQMEAMIELTLVEIETNGCAESLQTSVNR